MKNLIITLLKIALIFINVWFIISYIDVLINNTSSEQTLAIWNFFRVVM